MILLVSVFSPVGVFSSKTLGSDGKRHYSLSLSTSPLLFVLLGSLSFPLSLSLLQQQYIHEKTEKKKVTPKKTQQQPRTLWEA